MDINPRSSRLTPQIVQTILELFQTFTYLFGFTPQTFSNAHPRFFRLFQTKTPYYPNLSRLTTRIIYTFPCLHPRPFRTYFSDYSDFSGSYRAFPYLRLRPFCTYSSDYLNLSEPFWAFPDLRLSPLQTCPYLNPRLLRTYFLDFFGLTLQIIQSMQDLFRLIPQIIQTYNPDYPDLSELLP